MASELVRQMIDSGIHYGHRTSRWNPKMRPYIYGRRNLIHIIDIRETVKGLLLAKKFLSRTVSEGKDVLFVGTKRQAKQLVLDEARRVNMHYVTERWLGGTLTNFSTIRRRLTRLEELEVLEQTGELANYSKKMISTLTRERNKIKRNLDGIRKMTRLPGAVIVVDVKREHIALKEARKLGIPTVCLIDTDSDPDFADIPIPGNDDAIRAIALVLQELAGAIEEGLKVRPERTEPSAADKRPRRSARGAMGRAEELPPQAEMTDGPVAAEAGVAPASE